MKTDSRIRFRTSILLAAMLSLSGIASPARADHAENAFVTIRAVGSDVKRVDGRNFAASEDGEIEIDAQPGWTLLTPSRVRVTKNQSPRYRVKSASGEDEGGGDVWREETEILLRHTQDPEIAASLDAGGPYVYAAPSNGVWIAVSGSATATPGLHVRETRTTLYHNGDVVDHWSVFSEPFPLELDQWKWTWSPGAPGETNAPSFVSEPVLLSKATYIASGTVEAWSSQCEVCHASESVSTNFLVSLLTVSCNPWIGQDRTGDPSAPYESPKVTATASLDPVNPAVKKVSWGGVNKCEKREPKDWSIMLWTEDREKASDTYLGETITASVAGATATTNFTIVKVDVVLGAADEEKEETSGVFSFVPDIPVELIETNIANALLPIRFLGKPNDLPGEFSFYVACAAGDTIFALSPDRQLEPFDGEFFSCGQLSGDKYYLYSGTGSSSLLDSNVSIDHVDSLAKDGSNYTSVQFDFAAQSDAPNPLIKEDDTVLTDNRPATISVSWTPEIPAGELPRLSFESYPIETTGLVNRNNDFNIEFSSVNSVKSWRTTPVFWYGILPEDECYTSLHDYDIVLHAGSIPVRIKSYSVSMPDENASAELSAVPPPVFSMYEYKGQAESADGSGKLVHRFKMTFPPYTKNVTIKGIPATSQYADKIKLEEEFHRDQQLGFVPLEQGGWGDCYTPCGLQYYAEQCFVNLTGESLESNGFLIEDEDFEMASMLALLVASSAIKNETEQSRGLESLKWGFMELKAKEQAAIKYNAAFRYHCTYRKEFTDNPPMIIHPAFRKK